MIESHDHNPNPDPESSVPEPESNPNPDPESSVPEPESKSRRRHVRKRRCLIAIGVFIFLIMLLFIILLVLILTVFKARQPRIKILSASLDGVSPSVSFPVLKVELNISLNLQILVENRNHASFKHGYGQSILLYREEQVGEVEIYPGKIPARGSTTIDSRLTLQIDKVASQVLQLVRDIIGGELAVDTHTRIPGRVTFLGFIRKHAVAISECHIVIGVSKMKVRSQECKEKTKL